MLTQKTILALLLSASTALASLPPIQVDSGAVVSARSFTAHDRFYVTGRALTRPRAHVAIELVGPDSRPAAKACASLAPARHPRTAEARAGTTAYVVSFPAPEASAATKVRVSVHAGSSCL